MPRPHMRLPDMSTSVMENFARCNKDLLQGFIYVRDFSHWKVSTTNGFKWPKNKENLDAANRGSYNYISLAFGVRSKLVILPITAEVATTTESFDDIDDDVLLESEQPKVVEL